MATVSKEIEKETTAKERSQRRRWREEEETRDRFSILVT